MSSIDEARKALGQLFCIGFEGLELEDSTSAFFSQAGIGATMLRAHNYENPAQVAELTNQIQDCRGKYPIMICLDQEGGRVQRFKKPFTLIPAAGVIAAANSPKLTFEVYEVVARELKAVGINVNFAPVADILTNPKNPVIGNRSYGSNEVEVTKMITAVVRGHLVSGVQPCVKHFPGHGDTSVDSHFSIARVDTPLEVLREREFKPFVKAMRSKCGLLMTAHIINPHIDPDFPATLSKKTMIGLLRQELRYSGVIISDDMEMKAITDHFGVEDAPRLAIEAGCDLLIYRSEEAGRNAYQALDRALTDGTLSPTRVLEAAQTLSDFKQGSLLPYEPAKPSEVGKKVGTPEHQQIIDKITAG